MLPRHLNNVPKDREAHAPYNFVELPNKVIEVPEESLPQQNSYYPQSENRYTGKIECRLTTKSPLYTRCGLLVNDFAKFTDKSDEESKDESDKQLENEKRKILSDFSRNPVSLTPTISGSSLRGMFRSLVEIISFSKIDRVSNQQYFFFRAVAAKKDDPLAIEYKKDIPKKIKAGYLSKIGISWYIRPAKIIENSSFIWVKEQDLSKMSTLIKMNQPNYLPQYVNVTFGNTFFKNSRRFTKIVSTNQSLYPHKGILVTSGNMLESSDSSKNSNRVNHCIVLEVNDDANVKCLKINDDAIKYYCSALTEFQKQKPFDKKLGVLQEGRPIFYCEPQNGQEEVTLFGHCPNFRIPYSPNRDGIAASTVDFIPEFLRKSDNIDLAEAIFGFVKAKNKGEDTDTTKISDKKILESLAGRVFIEDAICLKNANDDIWLTGNVDEVITPKILSTPKPTTFQHYLVQKSSSKSELKHYASKPPINDESPETVIRGHKLYWHKPDVLLDDIQEADTDKIKKARLQYTDIKPIKEGVSFKFFIRFENLNEIELGGLLWVLHIVQKDEYCLSLGMGKPLGMGAVKIIHELYLSNRNQRYSQLFNNNQWLTGEENQADTTARYRHCIQAFEKYVLDNNNISDDDHPKNAKAIKLEEIPRIQMLLAMLRWDIFLDKNKTQYMTIEPNEYTERPVLPTPLQILDIVDNRKHQVVNKHPIKLPTKNVITKDKNLRKFKIGEIVDARITKITGIKVTYQILETMQKSTEKEPNQAINLQELQIVKVIITALKEDDSIKNVKFYE
ncbi:MAG: TIGR03986 family CRISPR-associated RAMP protein [Scytonematopsis contorta HA4267-MV1]|jgi:CRISPR-associated protein (TIGR03986 family)|nr:TIGR03986 family CRISPR-associated RAMP protein [Scytonematopsis contorta HA4267-MV1]